MRLMRLLAALACCAPIVLPEAAAQTAPDTTKLPVKAGETVLFAVSGTVLDEAGAPIPGASVLVPEHARDIDGAPEFKPVRADAQGRFRFEAVLPQSVAVTLRFWMSVPEGEWALPVTIHAPGYAVASLLLKQGVDARAVLKRSGVARGVVQDENGRPVAKVVVRGRYVLLPNSGNRGSQDMVVRYVSLRDVPAENATGRAFAAETDAQGRWTIRDLPVGGTLSAFIDDSRFVSETADVPVTATENTQTVDPILTARPGATVSGRVLYPDGKPVVGARVFASNKESRSDATDQKTGADGTYKVAGLRAGVGTVRVAPPSEEWVSTSRGDLKLVAGEEARAPDITLSRGVLVTGRVLERGSNAPVPGATVSVLYGTFTTNEKGEYQARVEEGEVDFRVSVPPSNFVPNYDATTLKVRAQTRVAPDLFLKRGLTLSGTVRENGQPVPNVTVTLPTRYYTDGQATSDANGAWEIRGLAPERFKNQEPPPRLRVGGEWEIVGDAKVSLPSPPVALSLRRIKLQDVTVRVVTPKGAPVAGADVTSTLYSGAKSEGSTTETLLSNDKGEVVLRDLRPDQSAELSASKTGFLLQKAGTVSRFGDLNVPDTLRASEIVMLPLNAKISGRALNAKGEPLANARVAPLSAGELRDLPDASVLTDAQGRFTLTGLPEAEVTIGVAHERDFSSVKLTPSDAIIDVTLSPSAPLPPERDIEGAFALLEKWSAEARAKEQKNSWGYTHSLMQCAYLLAVHDPERAARAMTENGKVSETFAREAPIKLARTDAKRALDWGRELLAALPDVERADLATERAEAMLELAAVTAKVDPVWARKAYDAVAVNVTPTDFSAGMAYRYARLAALAGALENGDSEAWTQALLATVTALPANQIDDYARNALQMLSVGGQEPVRGFLNGLPPLVRVRALADAMGSLVRHDVALARTLLQEAETLVARPNFPADPPRDDNNYRPSTQDSLMQARYKIAQALLSSDPKTALDLLTTPSGNTRWYPAQQLEARLQLALKGDDKAREAAFDAARAQSYNIASAMARAAHVLAQADDEAKTQARWREARAKLAVRDYNDNWGDRASAFAFYQLWRDPAQARLLLENEWHLARQAFEKRDKSERDNNYEFIMRLEKPVRAITPLSLPRALEMLTEIDAAEGESYYIHSTRPKLIAWLLASQAERRAMTFDHQDDD